MTKVLTKVAQMISKVLGNFEKPHSYVKTAVHTFRQLWETFGLLFTPTSGHTGFGREMLNGSFIEKKDLHLNDEKHERLGRRVSPDESSSSNFRAKCG